MSQFAYAAGLTAFATKKVDLLNDNVKVMLTTSAYAPNQGAHATKADVTNEITGTGYTPGGLALTGRTLTQSGANTQVFDCDDPTWYGASFTARFAVFYVATGVDNQSPLLVCVNFITDQTSAAGPFAINIPSTGLMTLATT